MCRLRVCGQGWQRIGCSGGWQAVGQDFATAAEGVAHLTTLLRLALSVSPSFSQFEFFSPLHPLHAIFSFAFAIRHEVMVMVIGGGQGGRGGARLRGGWGALMDRMWSMGFLGCIWCREGWGGGLPVSL